MAELPAILNWAIEGRRMLRRDGRFIIPESARDEAEAMSEMTSPIRMFVDECCVLASPDDRDPVVLTPIRDVFQAWTEWCRTTRNEPGSENIFDRNLRSAIPSIKSVRPRGGEARIRRYVGISLTDEGNRVRREAMDRNLVFRGSRGPQ